MSETFKRIITLLHEKGISLEDLVVAINETCDPRKPIILISKCEICNREFMSSHARVMMNKQRGFKMLCQICKEQHEREGVVLRMRKHRQKLKGDSTIEATVCVEALRKAKRDKGRLTAEIYSEWQSEHTEYPSKEDLVSVFGSWKNAKEQIT